MANKALFRSTSRSRPVADTVNRAGGKAYSLSDKEALAQYAVTGCLTNTFYASAEEQFDETLALAQKVEPKFLAQTAVYARQRGLMKDMPALLLAVLSTRDSALFRAAAPRVLDNMRMVRTFVQIVRSGKAGRKSLGYAPRRVIETFMNGLTPEALFRSSLGDSPSMADVIRLVRPRPKNLAAGRLYGYLIGKYGTDERPLPKSGLPALVRAFEKFKANPAKAEVPEVPFMMLMGIAGIPEEAWTEIAMNANWLTTIKNLNTFKRHGVLDDEKRVEILAERLRSPENVRRAKAFPYQILTAYLFAADEMPRPIVDALHDAMEVSAENVPDNWGRVLVCTDTSGSMTDPVTGARGSATSKVNCRTVAALVSATILRRNPTSTIIPFSDRPHPTRFEPRDTILSTADKFATLPSGGTDCSSALAWANANRKEADLVVYVSDNQSWADAYRGDMTGLMAQWRLFKQRNPKAKMVLMDLAAQPTSQGPSSKDILNVGGFSDAVYSVIDAFVEGGEGWAQRIESVPLE